MNQHASERQAFWLTTLRRWDLAFYALAAVAAASYLLPATGGGATQLWSLGLLALLVCAYVLVARPAAMRGSHTGTDAYLALLVAITATTISLTNGGFVLLFIAYSQIWFFARTRWTGALWCVALTAAVVAAVAVAVGDLRAAWSVSGLQLVASLAFSVVLGLWITQIAETSEQRGALLDRLGDAQDELAASHHAAGVLAERERLAQEIHDTLAQGFTSIVMLSQTASALLERDRADEASARVAQIEQVARENLAEARALVAAFGPVALQGATLAEALGRLGQRFEAETGTQVAIELDAQAAEIDAEVAVALLRTAQEGLANVRRHAQARHVVLRLVHADGCVTIDLADDGRGLPADLREGVGLSGVRERAAAGGGSVELAAAPGGGTRLRLTLPVAS
ncbi:MAG: sensor histidine kinase [Actinobacteria bacterium]|nr:sensor histidine kinase [Actinomycetota bacterium]MCG2802586.1 sensor histidine kinase [Cellulomonas sp.]